MGKVVPKENIAFVFEESKNPKTDTICQSLLGRMCGYGTFDLPLVFLAPSFRAVQEATGLSELDRYLRFASGETVMPARASHLSKLPSVGRLNTLPYPRELIFRDGDAEDHGAATQFRGADRLEKIAMIVRSARTEYTERPLVDPVQMVEVSEMLYSTNPSLDISVHDINSGSYAAIRERLIRATERKERYDDPSWDSHRFKAYYDLLTPGMVVVRLVGYTNDAMPTTTLATSAPIAPTTGREAFHPSRDAPEPIEYSPEIVDDTETMAQVLRRPGIHTLWIVRSLGTVIAQANALHRGHRGLNIRWNAAGRDKSRYRRITVLIEDTTVVAPPAAGSTMSITEETVVRRTTTITIA